MHIFIFMASLSLGFVFGILFMIPEVKPLESESSKRLDVWV